MSKQLIPKLKSNTKNYSLLLILFLVFIHLLLNVQNLTVDMANPKDFYRTSQLLDITDSNISFAFSPITPKKSLKTNFGYYPDSIRGGHSLIIVRKQMGK